MSFTESGLWDAYNTLLLGPDSDRLRKLLVRYEMFKLASGVPGDVVECGVFKGAGLLYWAKLLHIFEPASVRRVIGFDTFSTSFAGTLQDDERDAIQAFGEEADFAGVDPDEIRGYAAAAGLEERVELVVGDIAVTAAEYVAANRGFRIALLHLDLDTYHGTKAALEVLYPRLVRGGVVVFDEYGVREWGESDAVDEFLGSHPELRLSVIPRAVKPTAFAVRA